MPAQLSQRIVKKITPSPSLSKNPPIQGHNGSPREPTPSPSLSVREKQKHHLAMIQQSYNQQQPIRQPPSPTSSTGSRQSRRSPQPSRISPTTLTTKITTSSPHDGRDRDRVEAIPDRRPSPGIHSISQQNIHHQMPPPPQHSLSQPNIHGPAHYPPHRPIPRGPPPQFLSQQFQAVEDAYQPNEENWDLADEIIADMERADQGQLSSPGGKHGVAYAGGAQSGPIAPPKDMSMQRLVRNNPERVSPKEFIENAQTGANTRKPRDRTSQSSIPSIPSSGSPHSRTPEHRRSPSYPLRSDSPQPYSHYDYSQGRVPTPSGLRKVETISPPPSSATKLSNSTPPLQSTKTKSPDRSLPLQEEPEDHHDDYDLLHRSSPTPSSEVYPEGRPGYDLKARGGRDSVGRRVEDDDSATLNEDLSDEDDNHVAKPGQRDESSSSGFTPRSPSVALPDTNQRPDYHQATLRSRPRGVVTDQLNMRGFEQIFNQAADNKQRVVTNSTTATSASTNAANPPRIPPIAPPQTKDDKPSSQQTQDNQAHPGTIRQNQSRNPQRPQVATQPFYPPHLYPDDFYDPAAAYLQSYLQSPGIRPQAPIPPTPHSQTTAPSPSPYVHLAAGGNDLEQHRNVGSPYPHPFSHVPRNLYAVARTPSIAYDPNDPNTIREQMALQMQIYAINNAAASSADSSFSPSSTPFPAPGYNPWAFVPTMRGFPGLGLGVGRGGDSTMSLRSSPSHEPVSLPLPPSMVKGPQSRLRKRERSTNLKAVQERLMNGGRSARSKLIPPRVDSTQPRDTSPEMTDAGEETAGEEVHTHVEGDTDKWDVNGMNGVGKEVEVKDVTDAVEEITGDVDDGDWIDEDEDDDNGNDLLDLPYHPTYVRDENKRRRRWESKWEALAEAFHALDRQTDTTMILVAAPPHTRKLYSLMSRSIRRDSTLLNGDPVSSIRRSFRHVATQRRTSRVNHGMSLVDRLGLRSRSGSISVDSMGHSDVGSSESREDDLKRALEAALGSLDALGNIYEERETRWREEMQRLSDDRGRVELLLSQTFGKFPGMGMSSGGSGGSTVNGQNENLILMTHGNSYASGSTFPSYDMPRRKKKWYRFGTGRDRYRGQDVWYSAYVSPRGQQPPTPNIYAAYQRPSDRQRNPSMPVPVTTQYGSLHIPEGYIPPSVNPPVVPQDVISSTTDSEYWRRAVPSQHPNRPLQSHYRRPSQSRPPVQPVTPAVMPLQPFTEPISSSQTSSFPSPPFKPFQPLPEIRRSKPPTPPPKLLDLAPYRETLPYLSHPSPASKNKALEIIQNKEKTDIHRAHEEWKKQDEEREKVIREKKEERERLISGTNTIRAPTMQTVTALVVDPTTIQPPLLLPPPLPKKEKKSLWKRLFQSGKSDHSKQQTAMKQPAQATGPVVIPIGPQHVLSSIPGIVVPMQAPSQYSSSSSSTHQSPGHVARPTPTPAVVPVIPGMMYSGVIPEAVGPPVVMPSPSVRPKVRSTTPDISPPPTAAFFSIPRAVNV
ncbi:hypothetical protein BDM02DRAFT_3127165 [Thelephora ganbajun]|uniref:Uncharacterized protein n=1 Tax=Thelephora ganbajun TaxID=370292 RepID=A0ACB6ZNW5_THEGA|nr:hypothetical protein BDM02DRAFT_3127165 [Thelephora ganbajun]